MNGTHASQQVDLKYWMERAVAEMDRVLPALESDPVHDLRVALRRCRSIASSFRTIDFHPAWRRMDRAARSVFRQLGELRDVQVLSEWVLKLGGKDDAVAAALLAHCARRESELRAGVVAALGRFDRKRWEYWKERLSGRFYRVPSEGLVFQCLALHRLADVHALHREALRNRSKVAFHQLRIGLKRFRYVVENFLPQRHQRWGKALKELQDLLGEVHDLDVLWATASKQKVFATSVARDLWKQRIEAERDRRLARYRELMVGPDSLWKEWRHGLPLGAALRRAERERLKTWAAFLDPDLKHSQRVARLALQLRAGLVKTGTLDSSLPAELLEAAALLHGVGRSHAKQAAHKESRRLISRLVPPSSWTAADLELVALAARYARGALPATRHKRFAALPPAQRAILRQMAGILRLARSLDGDQNGAVHSVWLRRDRACLTLEARGLHEDSKLAERVAAGRYLLERICRLPLRVVGAAQPRSRRDSTR
ncbi:MAG TPA: CHAD domain-containing protein [Terriglobales bacterium]|nr:CHAD domain-containing protein [Terriglobales bacterium]